MTGISINCPRDDAFQVEHFGHTDKDGMVARPDAPLGDPQLLRALEVFPDAKRLAEMVRNGASQS